MQPAIVNSLCTSGRAAGSPRIAFCTTCKGRRSHVELTLKQNLAANSGYSNCVFVLLDYGGQDGLIEYARGTFPGEFETGRLAVYSYATDKPFQMAHAKNMAHRLGIVEGGEILVNLDADNYTGEGFASYLAGQFPRRSEFYSWGRMVKGELDRGISGRIAVSRCAFLMAGGYDEKFSTWSPDDVDFKSRLRRMGIAHEEIHSRFLRAVKHSDKLRFREYRHVESGAYNDSDETCTVDHSVSNGGRYGMGRVRRHDGREINLGMVPARVFGIGMHKTGTSSLHRAFELLGYRSAHWNTALWARQVWEEMLRGKSATVESYYAFSDLPFPLLYRELDRAYPGSKFVLTTRDETRWLKSVRNHWDPSVNPHRKEWDIAPFTHKLHKMTYGRRDFDADVFLERYRRHNREVCEYFKGRNDLLVMDLDGGAGWRELCDFLEVPNPGGPFPKAHQTIDHSWSYEI